MRPVKFHLSIVYYTRNCYGGYEVNKKFGTVKLHYFGCILSYGIKGM